MTSKYPDITILVDTREQTPWEFSHYSTAKQKLDTGDYTVSGLEDKLAIERKKSVGEIANNITEKRFVDVLERLSSYEYPFILLEFGMDKVLKFPVGSELPKRVWDKIKVSPNFLVKNILDWQLKYNINVLFCESVLNAIDIAEYIFKRVYYLELNKENK